MGGYSDLGDRLKRGHKHTERLHRTRNGDPPPEPKKHSGSSEPLAVRTDELANALIPHLNAHRASHPQYNGFRQGVRQMGFMPWLEAESGISQRKIWRVLSGETKTTSLSIADALLHAVGCWHYLQDGTVNVIPNPLLSPENYARRMKERGCW